MPMSANVLEIADGALTGTVETPIVDAARKRAELEQAIAGGIDRARTLAVGDGANDIPMIEGAGLGVAYRAKPKTRAAAAAEIVHGDLFALLYAPGPRLRALGHAISRIQRFFFPAAFFLGGALHGHALRIAANTCDEAELAARSLGFLPR